MNQELDIRALLSDFAQADRLLWDAVRNSDYGATRTLIRAMVAVERHYAAEIALLFDKNGNVSDVAGCPYCKFWHFGAYDFGNVCDGCHDCEEPLSKDEKAALMEDADGYAQGDNWTTADLEAGLPSRA